MRRIANALTLLALVAGLHGCAADAPVAPPPGGGGGGGGTNALLVQVFTSDANPRAGSCTLVQAVVSLNGNPVPDGTGVSFSTDFGTFSQNGLPTVSVVTTDGAALTALCSNVEGAARVRATVSAGGRTSSGSLTIVFQPDAGAGPQVTSCQPSLGSTAGNETITLNGVRITGTEATTRVQFTAGGITRDGIVTSVSPTAITVLTPAFPELSAPSNLTTITVTLGTNQPTPVVLSLPNCFTFGTSSASTPVITALLPSQGTKEGGTRVTIIGSGFANGVQVFFGSLEATVVSTNFSQIVALSPRNFGVGEQTVAVTVKNIASGLISNPVLFLYTPGLEIISASNLTQPASGPFTPVTIFGRGFQAPVAVSLAGIPALPISVSATELVVMPGLPLVQSCGVISGGISVTNINTGDTAISGLTFTYVVVEVVITGVSPSDDGGGANTMTTVTGSGFAPNPANSQVKLGSKTAFIDLGSSTQNVLVVTIPPGSVTTPPTCTGSNPVDTLQPVETVDVTVTNLETSCTATVSQAFTYLLPCVIPPP